MINTILPVVQAKTFGGVYHSSFSLISTFNPTKIHCLQHQQILTVIYCIGCLHPGYLQLDFHKSIFISMFDSYFAAVYSQNISQIQFKKRKTFRVLLKHELTSVYYLNTGHIILQYHRKPLERLESRWPNY